ncbi:MAG TPA: murein biosynthesis integral membrane protein MurJ [Actinomycetota bacterium]|nr:murein biosynthesis integral membrane protein MurJ [Actinomycetota bacterium]
MSLARGAAAITFVTAVSRITGFVRVVAVAGAMGTTFLANTYQTANTAPNVIFELVAAGVLTSVFVPTFVSYLVKGDEEEGWRAGDALTSVALVALIVIAAVVALAAPLIMRLLTIGVGDDALRADEISLGTTFLRLFAPQLVFYGLGMIMTAALHARRRFGLAAAAPIFNNIVVIAVYIAYAVSRGSSPPEVGAITDGQVLLLGLGTTAGVIAMTLCLVPGLVRAGWRFRFNFAPSHPAVRKGARLGAWALGYAGGYQAGLIAVLILANRVEGGVAAYQWAFTFFYLPHALVSVPIFSVLFTAMSEHAARGEMDDLTERLRDGLKMLFFILVPIALGYIALAGPLARVTLLVGVMTEGGADLVGRVLVAFALGLPGYSVFLTFSRAFYAVGDTRAPAIVNAIGVVVATALGAALFLALPADWAVAGLALGHSIGFTVAAAILGRRYARVHGHLINEEVGRSVIQVGGVGTVTVLIMAAIATLARDNSALALVGGGLVGAAVYAGAMAALGAPELRRIMGLGRSLAKGSTNRPRDGKDL